MRTRPCSMIHRRFCGVSVSSSVSAPRSRVTGICDALRMGAQDPDARVAAWRVEPDVGEVEVEGYEYSRLMRQRFRT